MIPAYLIEKLPLIRLWIDNTINRHAANSYPIKDIISAQKFLRLPNYFTDKLLSRAKVVLVENVPMPPLSSYGLTEFQDFVKMDANGITYKNTYFIKLQYIGDESLHFHELVHVIQWDYLGVDKFLLTYGAGLIEKDYIESPLEKMAYDHQRRFQGNSNPYLVEAAVKPELDILMKSLGF